MSQSKDIFSLYREEEINEEYQQDLLFIASDREERYMTLKEEANQETCKIIIDGTENNEREGARSSIEVQYSERNAEDTVSRGI